MADDKLNAPRYKYTKWTSPPPASLAGIVLAQGDVGWTSPLPLPGREPENLSATDGILIEADGEMFIVHVNDYVAESTTGGWCDMLGEMLSVSDRFVIAAADAATWIPAGQL